MRVFSFEKLTQNETSVDTEPTFVGEIGRLNSVEQQRWINSIDAGAQISRSLCGISVGDEDVNRMFADITVDFD